MNKFQISQKSKNENEIEPFTFSKNYSIKLNQLSSTNKESATEEKNLNNNLSNELDNEGQKLNELPKYPVKEALKDDNNNSIENKNNTMEKITENYNSIISDLSNFLKIKEDEYNTLLMEKIINLFLIL